MFSLKGKKALVTGGSRGIGKGIALALATQGADVAVNYRSKKNEAEKVVAQIKKMKRDSFLIQADVSSVDDVIRMFAEVKKRWGKLDILVNNAASIASGGVGVGFSQIAHYTASKGGVVALTENMALELAKKGINVNAIAPGVIETDMTKGMLADEKARQGLMVRIPKGRVGKPEDIGAAAAFLASDEADYITGTVLYVDGGWLAG